MVIKGERLSRPTYSVIQTITEGSTALCYKCWHEVFERDCVQKTVSLLGVQDAVAHKEPQLLKSFNHPHIVEVWEAQWDPEYDDCVTFVMPYYEGGSLHGALTGGCSFSLSEAIALSCNILDALHYLHVERGIVHRDVKPDNIFLSAGESAAYLGDLGSAAPIENGGADFSGGTPLYRAPESATGRYTPQSDLYSLGLVLLELVAGRFRYEEIDQSDVSRRLREGKRALAGRHLKPPSHAPDAMARLINKLLDPKPERRPKSALDTQRALENIRHLNWRQTSYDDPLTWTGEIAPRRRDLPPRDIRVHAEKILRGSDAGKLRLTAQWRDRNATRWRNIKLLEKRVSPGDQKEWHDFFKSVSTSMDHVRARR